MNIVPDRCMIEVDRRTLPGETDASVLAAARGALRWVERLGDCGTAPVDCRNGSRCEITQSSGNSDAAVKEITGDAVIESAQYATDAGVYNSQGIPAVVFGPGDIARAHTEEEYIEIDQLHDAVRIIQRVLE